MSLRRSAPPATKTTWRSRMSVFSWVVAGAMVLLLLISAVTGGLGGLLMSAGLIAMPTGLYVLATRRSSWAGLPRSRALGAATMAVGLMALFFGASVGTPGGAPARDAPIALAARSAPTTPLAELPTPTPTPTAEAVAAPVATAEPAPVADPVAVPEPEPAPEADAPQDAPAPLYAPAEPAPPAPEPAPDASTYYENCSAAKAAGAAPVHLGDPGYGDHLDRDGDGVGCEN